MPRIGLLALTSVNLSGRGHDFQTLPRRGGLLEGRVFVSELDRLWAWHKRYRGDSIRELFKVRLKSS
jgi:hypothetical protein